MPEGYAVTVSDEELETFNPWSVVHLVFEHLCAEGLHPTLGDGGDPAAAAAALLTCLSIHPTPEGNREIMRAVRSHLEEMRAAVLEPALGDRATTVSE